jgi:type I restriction enzyme S subunit
MAGEPARMCPTVEVLPDGWLAKRLGSFCTKIGTGATPRGGSEVYLNSRVSHALVRSQHVFDRHFDPSGLAFISAAHARELRNAELQSGDVLLNITGDGVTFGRSCIVPDRVLPACVNQHVSIIRPDPHVCDAGYLLSVLTHPAAKDYIESFNSGGSRRAITKGHIESFEIPLPPLPTQRAIAHVLGTLDDLIELNRETNEILEEMARALFKSWFVDFDPVRAKLEGRPPAGMDAATAVLFPDHFQDSELGQIPKGWEVGKVSDLATLGRVAVNPGRHPEEFFDHYSLPAFDDGRNPKTEIGSAIMSNKFLVEPDSVLLSKLNPHIPRVWFPDLDDKRRSVCSTEFMVARASVGVSREYLFSLFTDPYFASIYGTLVSGTTGSHQRISPDSFIAMQVVMPPVPLVKAFTDLVRPMFDTIHSNLRESRDLATLRDTLLPRLLSGEVSAPAAEELIAAST